MNWSQVKANLPDESLTAIPMIQDPNWIPNANTGLDGAFSWYAWPTDGGNSVIPGPMTTIWDDKYLSNLGDKPYMAREFFKTKVYECQSLITSRQRYLHGSLPISIPRTGSS